MGKRIATTLDASDPPKRRTYKITCVSKTLSPLSHMSGTAGNEQVIMREPICYSGGLRYVPAITGNAIRHRAIRAPLAQHIVETWDLDGQLTIAQLQFLFHGGTLFRKGGRISLAEQDALYRLMPAIQMLGCSLPGQIVPGNLYVHRGTLVCRENRERLARLLPPELASGLPEDLRPATDFIGSYQYTRNVHDMSAPTVQAKDAEDQDARADMMIFGGQTVITGAMFVHGFQLVNATTIEVGAIWYALNQWQANGGTIGGMASKGHGRLETSLAIDPPVDWLDQAADEYQAHILAVASDGRAFLDAAFAEPIKRKGKKGEGQDDEAA